MNTLPTNDVASLAVKKKKLSKNNVASLVMELETNKPLIVLTKLDMGLLFVPFFISKRFFFPAMKIVFCHENSILFTESVNLISRSWVLEKGHVATVLPLDVQCYEERK